jgi:hypothetical protein
MEPVAFSPLQSSSQSELALGIKFTPSPDPDIKGEGLPTSAGEFGPTHQKKEKDETPRINWPLLLVSSYASALTLGLVWLLWSGRGPFRPRFSESVIEGELSKASASKPDLQNTHKTPLPLLAQNLTELGKTMRLGDLELSPVSIVHRSVYLFRLEGSTGEERESPDSLVLTLRLTNRSESRVFSPLDRSFIRDSSASEDHSYIETSDGPRILMFPLAAESEWSIQDQEFPALKPGESAETIIVSEPVQPARLGGRLTWRVKVRTKTYQTDVAGVRFSSADIADYR